MSPVGRRLSWAALAVALLGAKVWLVGAQTVTALAPTPGDDELFLSHAETLLRGEWLGKLSNLTHVKGPGYPLWLALNFLAGLPLLLAQALLYAVACAVFVLALRPVVRGPAARALIFALLLFNPGSWATTRVVREGIYGSLTLLVLGTAIGLALRVQDGFRRAAGWALAVGVLGAFFSMTREEGVWLAPSLGLVALVGLWLARTAAWRSLVSLTALVLLGYAVPVATVARINLNRYGVALTAEVSEGYFQAAYGALARIKTSSWQPRVPVPREARLAAYAASPALRRVAAPLEREAPNWTLHGCKDVRVCDDIAGGWFMWALRGAAREAGIYDAGLAETRRWYESVAQEIDLACAAGKLDCLPARSTLASPWRSEYLVPLVGTTGRALALLTTFRGVEARPDPSTADERDLLRFERVTHERIPKVPPAGSVRIRILDALTWVYRVAMPVFLALGLFLAIRRSIRSRSVTVLDALALAVLCAVGSRALLLSLIDVMSFHAVITLYSSPAFAPYVAAVAMLIVSSYGTQSSAQLPSPTVRNSPDPG